MRLRFPSRSAPRSIGRLAFSGGLDSMARAALWIGCVIVPTVEIIRHGGFTPQTSIIGFGARVLIVVASIATLIQMWQRGEVSWRPPAR